MRASGTAPVLLACLSSSNARLWVRERALSSSFSFCKGPAGGGGQRTYAPGNNSRSRDHGRTVGSPAMPMPGRSTAIREHLLFISPRPPYYPCKPGLRRPNDTARRLGGSPRRPLLVLTDILFYSRFECTHQGATSHDRSLSRPDLIAREHLFHLCSMILLVSPPVRGSSQGPRMPCVNSETADFRSCWCREQTAVMK